MKLISTAVFFAIVQVAVALDYHWRGLRQRRLRPQLARQSDVPPRTPMHLKQASMPHAPTLLSAFSGMLSKSITKTWMCLCSVARIARVHPP
ncbi:hypothetical protein B0H14DRAFT_3876259 [Mycena olivaceomarginata]|nr:hypothetical protein B0H14DRAFT_3876259 [Mycena olivaceomarginata]